MQNMNCIFLNLADTLYLTPFCSHALTEKIACAYLNNSNIRIFELFSNIHYSDSPLSHKLVNLNDLNDSNISIL